MSAPNTKLSIKTKEGHAFKVLVELVQKYVKDGIWTISKQGMTLTGIDTKTRNGTKMVCVNLNHLNFTKYKCPDEPIVISVNMLHLFKMLKPIKKKDNTLTLFINEDDHHKLFITINHLGDTQKKGNVSSINISSSSPTVVHLPSEYSDPIVITSKDFQLIKTLNKVSKQMEVVVRGRSIGLHCVHNNVMSKSLTLGEDDDDEDSDSKNEQIIEYRQMFDSELILDLVKIASTSNTIQIYTSPKEPICFKMNVGTLGTVELYIKSKEMIEEEERDGDESDEEEINATFDE